MNLDEQRSPEIILEYFELLKWNKNGREVKISAETLDSDEQLRLIKQDLSRIQVLTIEKRSFISSDQKEIDRIKPVISSTEQSLLSLREKIISTRGERLQYVERSPQFEVFEQFKKSETSTISPLKLSEILHQFILGIREDLRAIYLDIKQAIASLDFLVLLQYFLAILIVIVVRFSFSYLIDIAFYILLSAYIIWKFVSALVRHKKAQKQRYENAEINRQHQARQQRLQKLESNLYELEQQYAKHEQYLNQQKLEEQRLNNQIRVAHSDLSNLEYRQDQQTENYQKANEEMIERELLLRLERLLRLEKLTQEWLEKDIEYLTEEAMGKLNLGDIKSSEAGSLKATPMKVLIGVTERTSPSLLIEDGVEGSLKSNEVSALLINSEEFKSEPTYSEKKRRYGVYEFLVIFLCPNFLSYYKCYFNFIRCKAVDDEYREYLYDSIVFTKVQEKSSVNMKNSNDQKQVYSKRLIISTSDGKTVCFRIDKSRVESNLSLNLSQIDYAATTIRKMLRQRRIDI